MKRQNAFSLCVDKTDTGKRLDLFVHERINIYSRSFISQLIRDKHLFVDGEVRKPGYRVKSGDQIIIEIPDLKSSVFLPEPMDLRVIYEDECIIVVDKPPGLVVHPAPGHFSGTLVNGLLHHCPDLKGISGELRPGIVHRLDKDTSGVIVCAKDGTSQLELAAQFKSRLVKKEYIALVFGKLEADSGKMDHPIGRHPSDRKKMSIRSKSSRVALTHWNVINRFKGFSLVTVDLKTGRTHQIRVHFAAFGHPIVGDVVYGGKRAQKTDLNGPPSSALTVNRQMLHAKRLSIIHPKTKVAMSFEANLPDDMAALIEKLKSAVT
jgi:23S rRNA pseudouridine1911/1915/1917 synthase